MVKYILILLCASVVYGQKPGLRVKYGGGSEEAIDKDFFFDIPRTLRDAEAKGWRETARPSGPLPHLKMYCPVGREVCPLYHPDSKFVAGIQLALPIDGIRAEPTAIKKYYVKWSVPASEEETARDYWAITQYFVPEDSKTYIPTQENGETLQFDGVWVKGPDGDLMKVPEKETNLKAHFVKQYCTPKMGIHYYFHLSPDLSCEAVYPWFPLVKEGKLIGLGFSIFAQRTKFCSHCREWYEIHSDPDFGGLYQAALPDAPLCFTDLHSEYKYIALHIYFIDEPWKVTCSREDSSITA